MTRVWVVRSRFGRYTEDFVHGGYVAAGWLKDHDLTAYDSKEAIVLLYKECHEHETPRQAGAHAGQIAAFALDIGAGDYVITPYSDTEWLAHGRVQGGSMYYDQDAGDGCWLQHRWRVEWAADPLRRWDLSVPFQNTLKAQRSVFRVSHAEEFLHSIGAIRPGPQAPDFYRPVLSRILELDPGEFQDLVGALLEALGFEETGEVPSACDGGAGVTCVIGELGVASLASVGLLVQVRRDGDSGEVGEAVVRDLRGVIPAGCQGAVITTSTFSAGARKAAAGAGLARIGLVDERQLVDLLTEHWNSAPLARFHEQLGLRPGLVPG